MKIIDFAYAVDTALMQGVKKFFNMQQVFLYFCAMDLSEYIPRI